MWYYYGTFHGAWQHCWDNVCAERWWDQCSLEFSNVMALGKKLTLSLFVVVLLECNICQRVTGQTSEHEGGMCSSGCFVPC